MEEQNKRDEVRRGTVGIGGMVSPGYNIMDMLLDRRSMIETELKNINEAISVLEKNPGVLEVVNLL